MKQTTRTDYEERLLRAKRYLETHLDQPVSLEELASVACFSPFHFSRIYAAMTGETVMATLRRLRLERAATALRYGSRPITDLAFEAGYDSLESFGRGFRKLMGMNPSTYRCRFRFVASKGSTAGEHNGSTHEHLDGDTTMEVTIQKMPDTFVAYVRHLGPYSECHQAWAKICSTPEVAATFGPNTLAIGIGYDDPDITESDKIRLDACISVPRDFKAPEGIATQTIEGGEFAVVRHVGSYQGLHDCYRYLFGVWLPHSGRKPKSFPSLEIYRNNPDHVPEDQLITDICLPLEP